ncbi:MAG: hypothetical protein VB143_00695 [Burkholderia sp.]
MPQATAPSKAIATKTGAMVRITSFSKRSAEYRSDRRCATTLPTIPVTPNTCSARPPCVALAPKRAVTSGKISV